METKFESKYKQNAFKIEEEERGQGEKREEEIRKWTERWGMDRLPWYGGACILLVIYIYVIYSSAFAPGVNLTSHHYHHITTS